MTVVADWHSVASGTASQPEPPPMLPNIDDAQQFYLSRMSGQGAWSYHYAAPRLAYYAVPISLGLVLRKAEEEITRLRQLRPGWDGGRAQAITQEAVYGTARVLAFVLDSHSGMPNFFPLPNGGIQIEWSAEDELEIEIDRTGKAYVLATSPSGTTIAEGDFDPQVPSELAATVARLVMGISRQVAVARQK